MQVTTSNYKVTTSDCEWPQVTTIDYKLLRVRLRVSTSQATSGHKWLRNKSETLMDLEWLVTIAGKKLVQIINCLITFCKFIINIISTIFVLPVNAAWPSYLHLIKYEWLMLKLWLNHREIFRFGLFIWTNNSRHETEFWKGLLLKGFTKKIAIFWVMGEI